MQALSLFSPVLRPLGVDLFCLGKKFLVYNLVGRNLKVKYRRSVFGLFWTLLAPLAMALVFYVVFCKILAINIPHYLPFILCGVIPFNFFSQTIIEGMESIVGNWGIASKVPVQLQIFPYVGALTNLVTLILSIPILIGASLLSHISLGSSLLLLPFYFLAIFAIAYGFSLLLAIGFILFRDLRHIMVIVMQIWFYSTPVIYSDDMIPSKLRWILHVNPVGNVFVGIRKILIEGVWPSSETTLVTAGWTIAIVFLSAFVYRKVGKTVVEQI